MARFAGTFRAHAMYNKGRFFNEKVTCAVTERPIRCRGIRPLQRLFAKHGESWENCLRSRCSRSLFLLLYLPSPPVCPGPSLCLSLSLSFRTVRPAIGVYVRYVKRFENGSVPFFISHQPCHGVRSTDRNNAPCVRTLARLLRQMRSRPPSISFPAPAARLPRLPLFRLLVI